jgi:DNA repair exonuclease SbcCD nuclease subunit
MKFGMLGDLHLTNKAPERRKDDYLQTSLGKVRQAMDFFVEQGCKHVFQVGDFFNSPVVARRVEAEVIKLFREYEHQLETFVIFGQHDITGHSAATFPNSPLAVACAAGLKILGKEGHAIGDPKFSMKNRVYAYGASFGQDVPEVEFPEACNILVIHDMIGNRPLWPGQPLQSPRAFLRSHPQYKIVLCGDYHYSFADKWGGRLILNTGALMRKNLTDIKLGHRPTVCTVDTETLEIKTLELKVQLAELIFDTTQVEARDSEALNRLANNLKESRDKNKRVLWKEILQKVIVEKRVSERAQEIIDTSMAGVGGRNG